MHEKNNTAAVVSSNSAAYATVTVDITVPVNPPTGVQPVMYSKVTGDITKVCTVTTCYYTNNINVREVKFLSILMIIVTLLLLTVALLVMFL